MRSSQSVSLYLRIRSAEGAWVYARSITTSNGRLRPLHALVNGRSVHCAEGTYCLRYSLNGKRIWQPVGTDPSQAQVALQRKTLELQAEALGMAIPEAPTPSAAPDPAVDRSPGKIDLPHAIAEYLADTAVGKSKRTSFAYSYTLKIFATVCHKQTLEQVERRDILNFIAHFRGLGNSPRTISNYVNFLLTFFRHHNVAWPLLKTDRVKYTEKVVSAYNADEIARLLAAANQEESDLLQFFLCTGARDREVQFAAWRDIDFTAKTFTVTEKLDLGWSPKDREEGAIPIPDSLLDLLRARRKRYPGTRLIFPGANGKADRHFLRTLKRLALGAGLNCGHCYNKAGQCCAKKPVCKRFELHRFRKTYASWHHEAGVPARTIQRWLRHSSLDTTLAYLAASDDLSERTRDQVNGTFAAFAKVGGVA